MRVGAGRRLRKFFDTGITDETIWQEIIRNQDLSNLHQLKTLNAEAARVLIGRERRLELLSLGIIELTADVAAELAKYKGERLLLNCVKALTPEAAAAIAAFQGNKLGLNGVRKASFGVMKGLSGFKGTLMLAMLNEIHIDRKEKLAAETIFKKFRASRLLLNGMTDPPISLLRLIARFPAPLELNGIRELNPSKAAVLISHKGKELKLKGLSFISTALLGILLKYPGVIDISAVRRMNEEAIQQLASQKKINFFLHAIIRRKVTAIHKEMLLLKRKQFELERRKKLEEEAENKEKYDKARALLEEFEKFNEVELEPSQKEAVPAETAEAVDLDISFEALEVEMEFPEAEPEQDDQPEESAQNREARLNYEIMARKNKLNQLLRKPPDTISEEDNFNIETLRTEINQLKTEIKETLDLMVEGRELGAVVFNSSDDLVRYLKDSGAEDEEDDALAKIDDNWDPFGGSGIDDETEEEDIEIVPLVEETTATFKGEGFVFQEVKESINDMF